MIESDHSVGPLLIDVAAEVGISYRQADHWCACQYIEAAFYRRAGNKIEPSTRGSGKTRRLAWTEVAVLHMMAKLVQAGFLPHVAARIARSGESPWELAPGVTLHVASGNGHG